MEPIKTEKPIETIDFPSLPSRYVRRQNKLAGKKIIKKVLKGQSPRHIAHTLHYININKGEEDVKQFINSLRKR